tara:strand:+ start:18 stop:239 length:222 start_codon:yes stop_codon:yes gene_type:complete
MLPHVEKFGIYFNAKEETVVRITSPYWFPPESEWTFVTNEVNATLTNIRDTIKTEGLSKNTANIRWGRIPLLD